MMTITDTRLQGWSKGALELQLRQRRQALTEEKIEKIHLRQQVIAEIEDLQTRLESNLVTTRRRRQLNATLVARKRTRRQLNAEIKEVEAILRCIDASENNL